MIYSHTLPQTTDEPSPIEETPIKPIVYTFEIDNGNKGVKTVIEPMLREYAVARQRAIREFMDNGYTQRFVTFSTWRTDIKLNDIIEVHGLKFKVQQVNIVSDKESIKSTVRGIRYE